MSDAKNNPVKRQYTRREVNTGEMEIPQRPDVDLSLDATLVRGEALPYIIDGHEYDAAYMEQLAFMEEPVTIRIEENSRGDFPEPYVPVQVNGRGAEIMHGDKWLTCGWLPVNQTLTTKRKYVEVLARSRPESIRTKHDDATVERPQNKTERVSRSAYPISVIRDDNPRGHEWLTKIMAGY